MIDPNALVRRTAELHAELAELWEVQPTSVSISIHDPATDLYDALPGRRTLFGCEHSVTEPMCVTVVVPNPESPVGGLVDVFCPHAGGCPPAKEGDREARRR